MVNYKIQNQKVVYLNSEVGCTKSIDTTTNNVTEFSWSIPSLKIDDLAHLKV